VTIAAVRERYLKDERGFTLSEMLVTIIIMMVVFFALFSIFDMSLKVFSFGNNKVEAVESARVGMGKMEREIRQAYAFNRAASPSQTHLFFTTPSSTTTTPLTVPPTTVTQLTFGNNLGTPENANHRITCGTPCEYITYKLVGNTLRRVNTSNSADAGEPVVENVATNGLSFTFLKSNGGTPANEGEIGMVLLRLNIRVDQGIGNDGTQELTTVIDLRNRP
jgi:type II secretory pathway component PulJ